MENKILKKLLDEYSVNRFHAEEEAQKKKDSFYSLHPDLKELEKEINQSSLHRVNLILMGRKEEADHLNVEIDQLKQKKQSMLKQLGINSDYFLPNYHCPICQDTGYVKEDHRMVLCHCLQQKIFDIEYNKSNMGNMEKENFSTFDDSWYSDKIDPSLNLSPRKNIHIIKNIAEHFIDNFQDPNEKNLLFTGNIGLGKTFFCNCIAYELLKRGKTVLYQTAPVMLDSIIDYRFGKSTSSLSIIDNILNVDLLIIDDLGTESLNSLKLTELFTIINARLLNQNNHITKTIISTNLNLNNIFSIYNERIGSRIIGYYNICKFIGDDIRLQQGKIKR